MPENAIDMALSNPNTTCQFVCSSRSRILSLGFQFQTCTWAKSLNLHSFWTVICKQDWKQHYFGALTPLNYMICLFILDKATTCTELFLLEQNVGSSSSSTLAHKLVVLKIVLSLLSHPPLLLHCFLVSSCAKTF